MNKYFQFSSVTQSCPTLCNPMNRSTPGFPVHYQLQESTQTHVHRVGDAIPPSHPIESVMPSHHLILCRPLLLLPSIFPSIRVFSKATPSSPPRPHVSASLSVPVLGCDALLTLISLFYPAHLITPTGSLLRFKSLITFNLHLI